MVNFRKCTDGSQHGGHSAHTSYTKLPDGSVPEYVLGWRRYATRNVHVTADQAYYLRRNDLRELSSLYARTLR